MKFTQGPWLATKGERNGTWWVRTGANVFSICYLIGQKEVESNARLISASPDLFDVVSRVLMEMEKWDGEISIGAVEDMQAAIAKATGVEK